VKYLVPNYVPLGKQVVWAGDGGLGKSMLTLDLIACLTTGRPCLGLAYDACPPCDVLLINCEDDVADTIYPRLLAAGADLGRVFMVDGIKTKEGKTAPFSLAHYEAMNKELRERPGIRLAVIDPAGAFIGRTGIDDHKDSQLRALLGPLTEVAGQRSVTILLVKHVTKGVTPKAVHKVSGSAGYVNAVRAASLIAPDPDAENRQLFLPLKNNLCAKARAIPYETQALPAAEAERLLEPFTELSDEDRRLLAAQLFRIRYFGQVDVNADDVMTRQAREKKEPNKVEKAVAWLERFLETYAYPSDEILAAAQAQGFTFDNVKEAKTLLKAKGFRSSNRGRFGGVWWTGKGHPDNWRMRPAPYTPHTPHYPHNERDSAKIDGTFPIVGIVGSVGGDGQVPFDDQSHDTPRNEESDDEEQ
jgi:hypothetical protein